jgi:hypothetical protein
MVRAVKRSVLVAMAALSLFTCHAQQAIAPVDGQKASYTTSESFTCVTGDVAVITGSSTKKIRVTHVEFSVITTGTAAKEVYTIVKRSTLDSGGTSASMTVIQHDSNDASPTATLTYYTVAPTSSGSAVGTVQYFNIWESTPGSTLGSIPPIVSLFGTEPGTKALVLNNANENLTLNLNAATATATCSVVIRWTEE